MLRILLMIVTACVTALPAMAQEPRRASHCIAIAQSDPLLRFAGSAGPERLWRADWTQPLADYTVRLHYISHASFLIQTASGITAVTDYTGFIGPTDLVPDVVTMNHAHSTHWTANPDPAIPHVLPGWGAEFGSGIDHHLEVGEMLVRNVSTDIRSAFSGEEPRGNSIFIFEVDGLCIGHLGHLHHEPNPQQYAAIGRLDVVMVPVDGGYTLDTGTMTRIVERLRSSIVVPMHWFSDRALDRFLTQVSDVFTIDRRSDSHLEVSLRDLPSQPRVVVLTPRWLQD